MAADGRWVRLVWGQDQGRAEHRGVVRSRWVGPARIFPPRRDRALLGFVGPTDLGRGRGRACAVRFWSLRGARASVGLFLGA